MTSMATLNPNLRSFWKTRVTPEGDPVRFRVLYGGRMSSKCLAVGTRVMMHDGSLRNVEDISVGDHVMGPDSKPRTVKHTTRGFSNMYRVRQSSADDYVVNEDHIISVKRVKSSYHGKKLASGGVSPRYPHLGDTHDMNIVEYMNASKKFRISFVGFKAGAIQFPAQSVSLDPYLMGLWLGDGDSDNAIITNMESEIEAYLHGYADSNEMVVTKFDNRGKAWRYRLKEPERIANRILTALRGYGVLTTFDWVAGKRVRVKADKRIPHAYIQNSEEVRLQLLAGLIDTDGTFLRKRGSMVISSSRQHLAQDIKHLVDTLGFKSSIHKRQTSAQNGYVGEAWVVTFSGALHKIPCKVARKIETVKNRLCDPLLTYIEVIPEGWGEYAGFSVDGDHRFCLADGTVTHNSHDMAGFAIARANFSAERFLCLRMYQNRIADSVFTLLKDKIEYFGLQDQFKCYADAIEHKTNGSLFRFYGIARNVDEIKSFEGATVCWFEEAHNVTKEAYDIVRPTVMRNEGAEMWFSFNPRLSTDFVYKRFVVNPPKGSLVKLVNYPDNPFLSGTAISDIEASKEEDYEDYQHIYLGVAKDDDDSVVIKRSWLQSAIDAHKTVKPSSGIWTGTKVVGYDVADDGDDKNATSVLDGSVLVDIDEWKGGEDELRESAAKAKSKAEAIGANNIGYDSIGVGAGTGAHLNSLGWNKHFKFNAGGAVVDPERNYGTSKIKNKDFFANIKAQAWWLLADRFRNTHLAVTKGKEFAAADMISISSECDPKKLDKLIDELSTPKRDFDNQGKVKVESKKDLKKRDVASPNIADSLIIASSHGMVKKFNFFAD